MAITYKDNKDAVDAVAGPTQNLNKNSKGGSTAHISMMKANVSISVCSYRKMLQSKEVIIIIYCERLFFYFACKNNSCDAL